MPAGIATTGYPAVRDKLRDIGIVHDGWQQGLGRLALGKRADGKYAATVGGIVLSIPRQVGKTFVVGTIIIALCLLVPGLTVLWTAHRTRTADETFLKMKGITARRKVKPFMLEPRSANGQQEIRFRNGSRIMFGAREQGFGRGFDEVDVEVFDEAQILTERALEDMVAATNQSRQPSGALLFYMGTPPRPSDPGEAFTLKRKKALENKAKDAGAGFGDLVYVEMSADANADPDDRKQWAKANASYPTHTPVESMMRLRENVGSEDAFMREGLGVWDEVRGLSGLWALSENASVVLCDVSAFAVAVSPDRDWAAISAAGLWCSVEDGVELPAVAAIRHQPGTDWVVASVVEVAAARGCNRVVVDGGSGSPSASLIPALTAAGLTVVPAAAKDIAQAYGLFNDSLAKPERLWHRPAQPLDDAVKNARTRPCGDGGKAFGRKASGSDITPLEAASLAHWCAVTSPKVDVLNSIW